MARPIDADAVLDRYYAEFDRQDICDGSQDRDWLMRCIEEAPTLTQPNEPLTLEELREMDGEPVWGKSLITGKPGEWFILRVVEMSKTWFIACAGAEQGFGDKDTYGETWVAHRRPLEGEGKN